MFTKKIVLAGLIGVLLTATAFGQVTVTQTRYGGGGSCTVTVSSNVAAWPSATNCTNFNLALTSSTGNVTSATGPTNLQDGVTYTINISEDSTGGWTNVWPSIFANPAPPNVVTVPSAVTNFSCVYHSGDGTCHALPASNTLSYYSATIDATVMPLTTSVAYVTVTGPVSTFNSGPSYGGSGYVSGDVGATITLGCGATTTISSVTSGQITGIATSATGGGSGCSIGVNQPITGGTGSGALVEVKTLAGSSYTSTCTITSSSGSGATCVALVASGNVYQVIVTNPGSGYTSAPTVAVASGSGLTFTAVLASDMSDQINECWGIVYAVHSRGATCNARAFSGNQSISHWMFANYPGDTTFDAKLETQGVEIRSAVSQAIPPGLVWDGNSGEASDAVIDSQTQKGTVIRAANGFTWTSPLIYYANAEEGLSTGVPHGQWLKNLGIDCGTPGGTYSTSSIGFQNEYGQEQSGAENVGIWNCQIKFDLENAGANGGALNSGPYTRIFTTQSSISNSAGSVCFAIGSRSQAFFLNSSLTRLQCDSNSGTQITSGMTLDASGVRINDYRCESCIVGAEVASNHPVYSAELNNVVAVANSTSPTTSVVDLSASNTINELRVLNVNAENSNITNVLADHQTNGHTLTYSTASYLGRYERDGSRVSTGSINIAPTGGLLVQAGCPTGAAANTANQYLAPWNSNSASSCSSTSGNGHLSPITGHVGYLQVKTGSAGVNSSDGVVTVFVNGTSTALTCTVGTGTICSDTTDWPAISAGQTYYAKISTQASSSMGGIMVTFLIQ